MDVPVSLEHQVHGKERVRVARVWREGTVHHFVEWMVGVVLESDMEHAYLNGDNTGMTATDTMKNTCYIVAKRMEQRCSPEEYAIALATHLVTTYPKVTGTKITVQQSPWERVCVQGEAHCHGFAQSGSETRVAEVYLADGRKPVVCSGFSGHKVLKTTQSGYEGYIHDQYTSLPDTRERMVATSVDAKWSYCADVQDYDAVYKRMLTSLDEAFFGAPRKGVYSPSVQFTLFEMGKRAIASIAEVQTVTLTMPNIHFLPGGNDKLGLKETL
ncbi:hypothetical protein CYMTET_25992 [Cymbomonas tetramitiformis]|uniref:Uricase n=1 Tax=Cymbomonas tetramitiformis TaxID=36881 RepID=A0AAE0FSM4_9CHLO|nr:hypothetical protein CYMTET_25992 [Cymbomonas tetramitiformis]